MTVHLPVSMPEPTADPEPGAHLLFLAILEERLKRTTGDLDDEVADGIRQLLCPWFTDHRCSREHMAELLAMSGRTFDRRLRRRGTSYRALTNEIQLRACCLLRGTLGASVRIPTQSVHVYRLEVVPGSDLIPSTLPT